MFNLPSFLPQPGSLGSMIGGPFGKNGGGGGGGGTPPPSSFNYTNLFGGLPPQGLAQMMPQPGLPSGYAPPPFGVPFLQNPYLPFGSAFGLGLNFWAPGFGRGPGWPANLWSPPGQEASPQSIVPPQAGPAAQEPRAPAGVPMGGRGAIFSPVQGRDQIPQQAYTNPTNSRLIAQMGARWGSE